MSPARRAFLQNVAFWGVLIGLSYLGLRYALPCFLPLVLGAVLGSALHPAAAGLCQRTGWRYRPCAVLVAVAALTGLGLLLWGIGGLVIRQGSAHDPLADVGRGQLDAAAIAQDGRHFGVAYKYGILLQKISILKNQNKTELSQPRISRYTFSLYSSSLRISCLQCG